MSVNRVNPWASFSPPVADWFRQTFGNPTPPQTEGWPPIQRGEHTLILAPTGSGKTIAAFLWAIDQIYRELADGSSTSGVRLLYISPLKALNNDIERNLRAPLEGIRATAAQRGDHWPMLRVAVRTGDTPGHMRAQMVKHPPHILITTPESLYLILTSARARHMLRTVRTVILDEIHTLSGNKRGVHLSLTLERLQHLVPGPVQRIGLSATQRPLEEVARFLGGQELAPGPDGEPELRPRPVTIVDTGYRKPLDLQVVTVVDDFGSMPGNTIWPAVVARLLGEIRRHRTTLVFTNNRRLAERTADRLNAQLAAEETEEIPPGSTEALAPGGVVRDRGMFALGVPGPLRAHHGSMSREARRKMEEDLKAGRLPALVGTSSLELGIDIGTVDLVVQLQSPKSVAQGLQRVGRSGHLVGQTSTGRIYATFREDLVEAAAIVRGMLDGAIEETYTPQNALDVLAQQVLASVAVEDWAAEDLFRLVCRAYAYHNLSRRAFDSVLGMLAGRYYAPVTGPEQAEPGATSETHVAPQSLAALRARLSWDRINDRLSALPGSRMLAVSNAGTIPDTGAYSIYLADGKTRVGELDEEFVFESRPGDAFLFGSQVWRVLEIQDDRLIVSPAPGTLPRMPFWNGDYPWRPYELGVRIGQFRRDIVERLERTKGSGQRDGLEPKTESVVQWLKAHYRLDDNSVANLVAHVRGQIDAIGVMSSDRRIVAESFRDAVGEPRLVLHSPFGGRVNGAWAIALRSALRERFGTEPELMANDDGIIFRLPQTTSQVPLGIISGMTPGEARERILHELPDSAVFGAQFRMAAGRALLLPRAHGRRRTPFWLQRLKAKDLLAVVRHMGDFPILVEAYRACLQDVLDLAHLEQVLAGIQSGTIEVVPVETAVPSPVASGLLFYFMNQYIYEWDVPKAERDLQALTVRREALADLLAEQVDLRALLRPEAAAEVVAELQHTALGYQARSAEELAVYLLELGDRTPDEVVAMCRAPQDEKGVSQEEDLPGTWLAHLSASHRVLQVAVATPPGPALRWVPAELAHDYETAFSPTATEMVESAGRVLDRYLRAAGPVSRAALLERYAFDPAWLDTALAVRVAGQRLVQGRLTPGSDAEEYCDLGVLEQIQRRTLSQLRRAVQAVPLSGYAAFLARWQHLYPETRLTGPGGLRQTLGQLRGVSLLGELWDSEVLPGRLADYTATWLAALCTAGELSWAAGGGDPRHVRVRFFFRGEGALFLEPPALGALSPDARAVYEYLKSEGASFLGDLQAGLGLKRPALEAALMELVLSGLATNDNLAALWAILGAGSAAAARTGTGRTTTPAHPFSSSLAADLAERMGGKPRSLSHTRYREARRHVRQRLVAAPPSPAGPHAAARSGQTGNSVVPDLSAARWSLVHRATVMGPALSPEDRAARHATVLLERYGVLTRDFLAEEDGPYDWGMLYGQLQRMELRGVVRRGYFVSGLAGAQFALPEAVEMLRATANTSDEEMIVLNALDPANIYGAEYPLAGQTGGEESVPTARFSRVPSTSVVLWRGRPVLVAEDHGARLSVPGSPSDNLVRRALAAYLAQPGTPRHLVVAQWNGAPVWGSGGEAFLKSLGFYRSPAGLEWWAEPAR